MPLQMGWIDGSAHGQWTCVYNCPGSGIAQDGTHVLTMQPPTATSPSQTSASSITSMPSFGDFDMTVRLKTVQQLRQGSAPNSWEVAWLVWHYVDYRNNYWLILKPTGWELGKEYPCAGCPFGGQGQLWLATGSSPIFPVGPWYTVRVRQIGSQMTVWVDGQLLTTATDTNNPLLAGNVVLYCEDSQVRFDDITVSAP